MRDREIIRLVSSGRNDPTVIGIMGAEMKNRGGFTRLLEYVIFIFRLKRTGLTVGVCQAKIAKWPARNSPIIQMLDFMSIYENYDVCSAELEKIQSDELDLIISGYCGSVSISYRRELLSVLHRTELIKQSMMKFATSTKRRCQQSDPLGSNALRA
jgi:hypothetical protein